nr:unnamed protein product [Callosobruchus chinensis]
MFLVTLTVLVCLTKADVNLDNEDSTPSQNYENENLYDVYEYVNNLHLQRCALVAVGLKYFSVSQVLSLVKQSTVNL